MNKMADQSFLDKKKLPKALLVGPMRSGTTWTYEYFKTRDDVSLPKGVKEPQFFDKNYEKGIEWYGSHFLNEENKFALEIASSYFHSEKAPERIVDVLGKIPIIMIKRDPVDRSYSHFRHLIRYGQGPDDIHEAIKSHPEIISASRFEYHWNRWKEIFGEKNIHVIDFNLIAESPQQFLVEVCNVFGVEYRETNFKIDEKVNEGKEVLTSLTKIITPIADFLRSIKAYKVINLAKFVGMKNVIYGGRELKEDDDSMKIKNIIRDKLKEKSIS